MLFEILLCKFKLKKKDRKSAKRRNIQRIADEILRSNLKQSYTANDCLQIQTILS